MIGISSVEVGANHRHKQQVPQGPKPSRSSFYCHHGKRLLDLTLVVAALPYVLLLVALLALVVRLSGGSAFYSQERLGRGGRVFRCWKLCTMVSDAEQVLEQHLVENPQARWEWDKYQKLSDDPRITPVGRILRKTSLDELPQLWNVLRGNMSLVGPRPMMPQQYAQYPGTSYLELRPGLTGSWQISERNSSAFVDRARYDDQYKAEMSFHTDLAIMLKTVRVVTQATTK